MPVLSVAMLSANEFSPMPVCVYLPKYEQQFIHVCHGSDSGLSDGHTIRVPIWGTYARVYYTYEGLGVIPRGLFLYLEEII